MRCLIYVPQMAAFGGIERHVCTLAQALCARGHFVLVVTTSNSLGRDLRAVLKDGGVELRELPLGRGNASRLVKALWMLKEALRCRVRKWDVIYTNGQSALARFAWLAAGAGTRVVHHHHTAASAEEQRSWSFAFRRVLRRAPELVACSCATRDSLAQALPRSDIRFLPYLTPCPVRRGLISDRAYGEGAQLRFGFIGRLVAEKGIDAICRLSLRPELSGIIWHIHGSGAAYPREFFRAYPNIVYHGPFTGAETHARILTELDAVVLFSEHNEGMPLSLIEAMSGGLPWVATDQGGTREIAVDEVNSIVISGAPHLDRLAAATMEMARRLRGGVTSRLVQRAAYERTFDPETVLGKWFEYLEGRQFQRTRTVAGSGLNPADTTVIVLTYNRDRFVAEALASVRSQTYAGWELLLSDASTDPKMRQASSDAFDQHVQSAGDNRSRFLCCKPGLSQAEHLAAAFSKVRTPFVALLDDDDVWMPGHLARARAWLGADDRRGVYLANSVVIDTDGRPSCVRQLPDRSLPAEENTAACLEHILRYAFSSTSGIVLRTSSLSRHDFFVTSCVDVHLCVSALLTGERVGLKLKPGFFYRVHPGSAYGKGFQAHADRHRLRLHLAATHGRQISRLVPLFPLLALKSALVSAGYTIMRAGRPRSHGPSNSGRSVDEPAILAR